jgi:hypothetical protein
MSVRPLQVVMLWVAVLTAACTSGENPQESPTRSLVMNITLPGNVTVDEVAYDITGNGIPPLSGVVSTPGVSASFTVSVPAGQGHLLERLSL